MFVSESNCLVGGGKGAKMAKLKLGLRAAAILVASFGSFVAASSAAAEKIALVGGRLIDGFGHRPIADSVILIDGDVIERVSQVGSLAPPAGYRVISTEGMDVLPGLWENHAHLQLTGHSDYPHWQAAYKDRFGSEIMPASAAQLLLAGVTSARDLGAPLEESAALLRQINSGALPGPRLYMSGPFLQASVEPWESGYRWAVNSPDNGRARVRQLKAAGMTIVKLIDQDDMPEATARAIVDEAHRRGMKVVAHAHKPNEIRIGLKIGVDNFEHTGLTAAPEYPEDIIRLLTERTALGRTAGGPLFWTPTVEGLWKWDRLVDNPEALDTECWKRGLKDDTIADIKQSLARPGELSYSRLNSIRKPTLKRKIEQLREAGVVILIGTDSGIPTKFHCQSTWNEMDVLHRVMGMPAMEVIRAATYWPAVMMGVEKDFGAIAAGKKADIIAVRGDVLEHINLLQRVDFVMKGGVVYKENGDAVEALFSNN